MLFFSVNRGEIIESSPTDHPLPSGLILGKASDESPIHSVWAYNEVRGQANLITFYRPDPERWIDLRVRKPKP